MIEQPAIFCATWQSGNQVAKKAATQIYVGEMFVRKIMKITLPLPPPPQKKQQPTQKKVTLFPSPKTPLYFFSYSFSKGTFFSKTKRRPDLSRRRFFTRNLLSSVGTSLVDSSSFVHPSKWDPGWRRCMRWCVYCVCVCGKKCVFFVVVFRREHIDYIIWL